MRYKWDEIEEEIWIMHGVDRYDSEEEEKNGRVEYLKNDQGEPRTHRWTSTE